MIYRDPFGEDFAGGQDGMEFRSTLTPLQQGMLIQSIDRDNRSCYLIQTVFAWDEPIEEPAFQAAWQKLASGHEALRSRFEWKNVPTPVQVVASAIAVDFETRRDVALKVFLDQDLERGFALVDAVPWRVTLLHLPGGKVNAVWTFHHLLLDGRSHIVLLRELLAIYDGLLAGTAITAEAEVPHRLHAEWLQNQDFSYAKAFWQEYLKGIPGGAEFPKPLERSDGPVRYRCYDSRLGKELTTQLQAFSTATKISIGNIVQTCWAFVLGWLANRTDVVIGAVRAARKSGIAGGENLIGLMINTVPLRVQWTPDCSFESVLRAVAKDWNSFRNYEQTPLSMIQGWLNLSSSAELFSTVLSYSAPHFLDAVFGNSPRRERRHIWIRQTTPYCSMDASLDRDDLTLSLNLPEHLVEPGIAERLGEYLANTIGSVTGNAAAAVSSLSPLSAIERASLMTSTNTRWERAPTAIDWMDRIAKQAGNRAQETALESLEETVSWQQLEQRSNRVAAFLREHGADDGELVAVFLPRSPEFIWTCLGIMKAGAAYLPLDTQWPAQRIAAVLRDAHPAAVWTGERAPLPLIESSIPVWNGRDVELGAGAQVAAVNSDTGRLAYVIYTSGSSGTPKGVEVTQRGLQNLIDDAIASFDLAPDSRGAFVSNTAFDASVHEIWPLLAAGASVHLPAAALLPDPAALLRWMTEERITFVFVSVIVAEAMTQLARGRAMPLRHLLTGGDQLRMATVENLPFELINEYGPTEYSVVATRYPVLRAFDGSGGGIPIGKPLRGTRCYVMNEWQQLLPRGAAGELVLAGTGIARGYRNRPELTAQKFVANPLPEEPSARLYRTGDLVRWLEDGNLQFLGRIDSQVKLRGFRIELGEIEANLLKHPAVAEAVVILQNQPAPQLTAFVVPASTRPGDDAFKQELSAFLKGVLAEYMVPAEFIFLKQLPVTSSGKYDRRQLAGHTLDRAPESGRPRHRTPAAFASAAEAEMAAVWGEVLSVDGVQPDDRFLSLGGTSLSIIRLICAVEQKFGAEVPAAELFRDPTPAELVRFIEAAGAAVAAPLVRLNPGKVLSGDDNRSPLFLIPGAGGGIHWFRDLAEAIGAGRPVIGVELLALSPGLQAEFSVERAAAEIVELVCAHVKSQAGSEEYSFGGYSGGGLVALECARRLADEGKRVRCVFLLDCYLPPSAAGRLAQATRWLRGWWALPAKQRLDALSNRVGWWRRQWRENAVAPSMAQKTFAAVKQTHIDAFMRHRPAPYAGSVRLFFAEERPLSVGADVYRDWRSYLSDSWVARQLAGDHYSLMRSENAKLLAGFFEEAWRVEEEKGADATSRKVYSGSQP